MALDGRPDSLGASQTSLVSVASVALENAGAAAPENVLSILGSRPDEAPAPARAARGYIPTLDGWRALSILGVMLCHGRGLVFGPEGTYPNPRLYAWLEHGASGVDVFFAISGYLICTLLLREEALHGKIDLRGFYVRRSFRILPLYFCYLSVIASLTWAGPIALSKTDWWSCLLFWRNYELARDMGSGGWYVGHFWSLSVEEQFYLFFPTLLAILGGARARRIVPWLAVATTLLHGLSLRLMPTSHFLAATRIDALLWGCTYAFAFAHEGVRERARRWLTTPWLLGIGLADVALVAIALVAMAGICGKLRGASMWLPATLPLLVLGTALHPGSLLGRLLESRLLCWIGRLSYSLYIWQQLFLIDAPSSRLPVLEPFQTFPANVVAAFLLAIASYYVIERPFLRLGRRVLGYPLAISR
ncbi:acyltransferase family protein [Pendulispora albinea]|uniref:Acyltransferase n=1 Tax=Pendulispora albinea TaxID=2741071 RepID=A0ABZ2M165_9BACT